MEFLVYENPAFWSIVCMTAYTAYRTIHEHINKVDNLVGMRYNKSIK